MEIQLNAIIEKFSNLECLVIDIDHLTKTLKNSFDKSTMENKEYYYLESIIRILRQKTTCLKQKTSSLQDKLSRYNLKISTP